jgi:hypothetical protein
LELIDPRGRKNPQGAIPGQHRIYITPEGFSDDPSSDEQRRMRNPLPPEYVDGTVTFDIPADGTDQMNFRIQTRGRRR